MGRVPTIDPTLFLIQHATACTGEVVENQYLLNYIRSRGSW